LDSPEIKSIIFLICSGCWVLLALGFLTLVVRYLSEGAGLPFFGWMFSSGSVLIGMVLVIGLFFLAVLCVAVGVAFWIRAFVPAKDQAEHNRGEEK
jgi:hypothetical protein